MTIKIICEDYSKQKDYIEHIVNHCMWVEKLPMKLVLSSEVEKESVAVKELSSLEGIELVREGERIGEYKIVEGNQTIESNIIESRGLKIDVTARRVWVDGIEQFFSAKEFSILVYLAKRPNQVCSKEEILESAWFPSQEKKASTLSVHIKNIRGKLRDACESTEWIETIWGVGYRFRK